MEALRALPAQRVEGAGLDQALHDLAVEDLGVVLEEEVEGRLEAAGPLPGRDELLDGRLADALDRGQAEADVAALDREAEVARVDVGRQDLDAHLVALADVLDDLGRRPALGFRGQQGGHEVDRVVGLEVGRLVGQEGVGGAVGLVEAVLGELLDLLEDLVGLGRG